MHTRAPESSRRISLLQGGTTSSQKRRSEAPNGNKNNHKTPTEQDNPETKHQPKLIEDDPLDIHQIVLKQLRESSRQPVTSVYSLASMVTNACAKAFDQYEVPEDFQFFDFFESSISTVVSSYILTFTVFLTYKIERKNNSTLA